MLEHEHHLFDCDTCPVRDQVEKLNVENAEAWRVFHRIGTRFLVDGQLIPQMFEALTHEMPSEDVADLLDRLGMMYEIICPPRRQQR